MSFWEAKEMIKSVKSRKKEDNDGKVWKNPDDIVVWFEELKKLYKSNFYYFFLRKWIHLLRFDMKSITQIEQNALREKQTIEWELVEFHISDEFLDTEERLLREKMWIDKLKQELKEIKKSWNYQEIAKVEWRALNAIFHGIYEYPYQYTNNDYWFKPHKILESKEIYCVWFSLLWHAFLSELWIRHYGLMIPWHTAIEVHIGGKKYYFDPTWLSKVYEITNLGKANQNWLREMSLKNITLSKKLIAKRWDIEKVLFSAICQNSIT